MRYVLSDPVDVVLEPSGEYFVIVTWEYHSDHNRMASPPLPRDWFSKEFLTEALKQNEDAS